MEPKDTSMSTMNHEQAIQGQAAERYLLGELQGQELEAYEEHFFDCAACAEEVKAGAAFARAARAHFAVSPAATMAPVRTTPVLPSSPTSWFNLRDLFRPLPAFAFSLLLLLATATVYQNVVTIPRLRTPQVASFVFLKAARTAEANIVTAQRNGLVGLEVVVPPGDFSAYEGQIISEGGNPVASFSISAQQARQTQGVPVSIPAGSLAAGKYVLIVSGINGQTDNSTARTEVARFAFELQFQK
jgi:anti-sigma factor RsiW